uniref:Talin_middle domain-containing protein n=1 Tax=Mesocestoides corti TaxID=53468 RepID=A0A5K3FWP2_MESCO
MLASPFPNEPDSVRRVNAAALASNPLFVSAVENATAAALISKLATALSHVNDSMVQSLANKDSTESVASALTEAVQLLAAMTAPTVNLNKSVSKCMVALELGHWVAGRPVPQCTADSSNSTTSAAKSGQESSEGQSKSQLPKSLPQCNGEKVNIPSDKTLERERKSFSVKRNLEPHTIPR